MACAEYEERRGKGEPWGEVRLVGDCTTTRGTKSDSWEKRY